MAIPAPFPPLRVLYVTLEFRAGAFSGNGVYAQSQAEALGEAGHLVHVVSGAPSEDPASATARVAVPSSANVTVTELPVPSSTWGRLDARSGWRPFAEAAGACPGLVAALGSFAPNVVLGVDWSSLPAWRAIEHGLRRASPSSAVEGSSWTPPPFVFSSFRVFSRGDGSDAHAEEHAALERDAVAFADAHVALCADDADVIASTLAPESFAVAPRVIPPPLRGDVRALASSSPAPLLGARAVASSPVARRRYLTCCVRLSPEKDPEFFVALAEALSARGALASLGVVPLLCASTPGAFADALRARVTKVGGEVVREFLDAEKLGEVFRATALNVHPCRADAYGMTVVEAAAFGAASLVHVAGGGAADTVGCLETLRRSEEEGRSNETETNANDHPGDPVEPETETFAGADFGEGVARVADLVEARLRGDDAREALLRVGAAARRRALAWDAAANADATAKVLREVVAARSRGRGGDAGEGDARSAAPSTRMMRTPLSVTSWKTPPASAQARLRPLWRDATLAIWIGGEWVTLQAAAAANAEPTRENDPSWRFAPRPRSGRVLLTAHNPMGRVLDPRENAAAQAALEAAVAASPHFSPRDVAHAASVDAVGGAAAWCERMLALTLPDGEAEKRRARRAVAALARRFGQAATYEMEPLSADASPSPSGWSLRVVPCFPGLEGLASEGTPVVTRQPPDSMPPAPENDPGGG